jgi:protein O-mannosyl-transferase
VRKFLFLPSLAMNASTPIRPLKPAPVPSRVPPKDFLSPRNFFIAAIALAAAVFAVYSPALNFQFILDDHRFLSDPRILNSGHIWEYFSNYVWAQFTGGPPSFYRPIFVLWLRINYIFAGMSSWGWHFFSIGKHLAVAFLLGFLGWKLLKDRTAALLAATLFALHPAQTESVSWVTVPDPLMCVAILGSVLMYLKYAGFFSGETKPLTGKAGRQARKAAHAKANENPSPWWLVGSATLCFAAMLAKETGIILPVIFFVLAMTVQGSAPTGRRKEEDIKLSARLLSALRQTALFWCAAAVYLLLRFNALGAKLGTETQHLRWSTVLLSWPATLWFYVKVLLWPVRSYSFADPDLANAFSVRGVLLPAFAVLMAAAILAWLFYWAWEKAQRDLSAREAAGIQVSLLLGMLFLIVPILPALDLNALNPGDFLHGRYTYLPSIGLMLLFATAWHLAGKARIPLLIAAGALAVAFAMLTLSQDSQWKDDATVFTVAHQLAPHNEPVARNLANTRVQAALQLDQEGRCDEAIPVFKQVTQEYPNDWFAWAGLGDCQVQLNDLAGAEQSLHRAADISQNPRVREQWQAVRERLQNLHP